MILVSLNTKTNEFNRYVKRQTGEVFVTHEGYAHDNVLQTHGALIARAIFEGELPSDCVSGRCFKSTSSPDAGGVSA